MLPMPAHQSVHHKAKYNKSRKSTNQPLKKGVTKIFSNGGNSVNSDNDDNSDNGDNRDNSDKSDNGDNGYNNKNGNNSDNSYSGRCTVT